MLVGTGLRGAAGPAGLGGFGLVGCWRAITSASGGACFFAFFSSLRGMMGWDLSICARAREAGNSSSRAASARAGRAGLPGVAGAEPGARASCRCGADSCSADSRHSTRSARTRTLPLHSAFACVPLPLPVGQGKPVLRLLQQQHGGRKQRRSAAAPAAAAARASGPLKRSSACLAGHSPASPLEPVLFKKLF